MATPSPQSKSNARRSLHPRPSRPPSPRSHHQGFGRGSGGSPLSRRLAVIAWCPFQPPDSRGERRELWITETEDRFLTCYQKPKPLLFPPRMLFQSGGLRLWSTPQSSDCFPWHEYWIRNAQPYSITSMICCTQEEGEEGILTLWAISGSSYRTKVCAFSCMSHPVHGGFWSWSHIILYLRVLLFSHIHDFLLGDPQRFPKTQLLPWNRFREAKVEEDRRTHEVPHCTSHLGQFPYRLDSTSNRCSFLGFPAQDFALSLSAIPRTISSPMIPVIR